MFLFHGRFFLETSLSYNQHAIIQYSFDEKFSFINSDAFSKKKKIRDQYKKSVHNYVKLSFAQSRSRRNFHVMMQY